MQSHPMRDLRQDHLDRLRRARRQRHVRSRSVAAVHLPLTPTTVGSAWSRRRTAVAAALTPPLGLGLVTAGGGWAPGHALWTVVVVLAAVVAAATLATYLPLPRAHSRRDPGCSQCSAAAAVTVAAAAVLLAVAPHQLLMAVIALAATSVGLLQRLTASATCAV